MKRFLIALIGGFLCQFSESAWEPLPGHTRYNDACFLASHNSYASVAYGYQYAQQAVSIKQQLEMGVRGFMLDTRVDNEQVLLCHKTTFITRFICRGKKPMPFHDALITLRTFLENNPEAVLTIFLETYVQQTEEVTDGPFKTANLDSYIFKPNDWKKTPHQWPTLEWMRKNNKRLVIFNTRGKTSYCYNAWQHVVENQWGTLHPVRACKERPESQVWKSHDRSIYLLNYFPMFNLSFDNSYHRINTHGVDTFLKRVLKTGLNTNSNKDLFPTFLCMDYVDTGNGIEHVMKINKLKQENLRLAQTLTQSACKKPLNA